MCQHQQQKQCFRLAAIMKMRITASVLFTNAYSYICLFTFSGSQLQICPRGLTCCTEEMEQKLRSVSKDSFSKSVQSSAGSIQKMLSNRGKKFDGKQNHNFSQLSPLTIFLITQLKYAVFISILSRGQKILKTSFA